MPNSSWGPDLNFGEFGARMPGPAITRLSAGATLVVGDSFAIGGKVRDADTWPAQLQRMVGTPFVNAAVGGFGFDQTVLRAEDLLPRLAPRFLLVETRLEDGISITRMNVREGAPKPFFAIEAGKLALKNEPVPLGVDTQSDSGWLERLSGFSVVARYAMSELRRSHWWASPAQQSSYVLSEAEAVNVICLLIQRLGELRQQDDIPVALVFQYGGRDGIATRLPWEASRARIMGCASRERLPVVDLLDALRSAYRSDASAYQRLWVMQDNGRVYGHMSADGNNLVARLVFERLFEGKATPIATP